MNLRNLAANDLDAEWKRGSVQGHFNHDAPNMTLLELALHGDDGFTSAKSSQTWIDSIFYCGEHKLAAFLFLKLTNLFKWYNIIVHKSSLVMAPIYVLKGGKRIYRAFPS